MDTSIFKNFLAKCKNIIVLTGAGISAESGIPTFRGDGGLWKKWPVHGHYILAKFEMDMKNLDKNFTIITQNVDGFHQKAGSKNVIEMHGSLFKTKCLKCGFSDFNYETPICNSLAGTENFDFENTPYIDMALLPRCHQDINGYPCDGLLRPGVIWFGENIDTNVMNRIHEETERCDFCIIVGTSSQVYPAASIAPLIMEKGFLVAEFNIEGPTIMADTKQKFLFFKGLASKTLEILIE